MYSVTWLDRSYSYYKLHLCTTARMAGGTFCCCFKLFVAELMSSVAPYIYIFMRQLAEGVCQGRRAAVAVLIVTLGDNHHLRGES